jgi:hypothetical protein
MSRLSNWQRAASCSWVNPSFFRTLRIWEPTTFAGYFFRGMPKIELDLTANARFICYASVTALDLDFEKWFSER